VALGSFAAPSEGWPALRRAGAGLREFVESRPSLGVYGAVTRHRLWVGTARSQRHVDVALARRVALPSGLYPPGRRRVRGGAGRAQAVDVGRHRIVREAGLSTVVHRGVPLHELPQASSSTLLS
jgi:hypothetical protein